MTWNCSNVRRRLTEYHDGELAMEEQVVVENHLRSCEACAADARGLDTIATVLRTAATGRASARPEFDGFASGVVSRARAEHEESFGRVFERMFEDLHLVWAALSATAATFACLAIAVGICYFSRVERADSLAAAIEALSNVGSNEYPVAANASIDLPRQEKEKKDAEPAAIPVSASDEEMCALNATITREGRVSDLQLLTSGDSPTTTPNWTAVGEMLDSAARARFEPARSGGNPVAVNMVWLLAHLTVRPKVRGQVRVPVISLPNFPAVPVDA